MLLTYASSARLVKPRFVLPHHRLSSRAPLTLRVMSTFNLVQTSPPIPVRLPPNLSQEQLLSFPAFRSWLSTLQESLQLQQEPSHPLHEAPYKLRSIEVQSCDYFGGQRLGFIKLKAEVTNDRGESLPGAVFMRGGSVAMLLILQPEDATGSSSSGDQEEYAVLVVQPRIAAGSLGFVEIPAGMLDDGGTFAGVAAREIKEETGLEIAADELVDMTALTIQSRNSDQSSDEAHLQQALYPSPGGCDEFIPIFLARKKIKRDEMNEMKGRLTGLRDHGEKITLKICRLAELWKVGVRDGKTLAAVALYEGLKREKKL